MAKWKPATLPIPKLDPICYCRQGPVLCTMPLIGAKEMLRQSALGSAHLSALPALPCPMPDTICCCRRGWESYEGASGQP